MHLASTWSSWTSESAAAFMHTPTFYAPERMDTDISQMPMMSGVEVARAVRAMGCPIYIVGCTGNALKEDQDEYIGAGADDLIPKPIHQSAIEAEIVKARKRVRGETMPRAIHEAED